MQDHFPNRIIARRAMLAKAVAATNVQRGAVKPNKNARLFCINRAFMNSAAMMNQR
jgi:hypothetical protein